MYNDHVFVKIKCREMNFNYHIRWRMRWYDSQERQDYIITCRLMYWFIRNFIDDQGKEKDWRISYNLKLFVHQILSWMSESWRHTIFMNIFFWYIIRYRYVEIMNSSWFWISNSTTSYFELISKMDSTTPIIYDFMDHRMKERIIQVIWFQDT